MSDEKLKSLVHVSHQLDGVVQTARPTATPPMWATARSPPRRHPRLRHRQGAGDLRHVKPDAVGDTRKVMVSGPGGQGQRARRARAYGIAVERDDPRVGRLLEIVKEREAIGYAYEAAEASFELWRAARFGTRPRLFRREALRRECRAAHQRQGRARHRHHGGGQGEGRRRRAADLRRRRHRPRACARPRVAQGSGQVSDYINGLDLTDYRVRILNSGTEAVTRVLIESRDETGERWTTVGVSPNIDRGVVPGADGFDRLQAGALRRAGVTAATGDRTMIDHVSIAVRDLEAATRFYDAVLAPLGLARLVERPDTVGYGKRYPEFWLNRRKK